ncbi:Nn.00g017590.m01.CDS01 [Neocucurbitaria sp. VM-36]
MTNSTASGPSNVAPPNSSGIKVIVVGLGLGGLTLAIECVRKGHAVIAFEQHKELKPIGDSIAIPWNAARIVKNWGDGLVDRKLEPLVNKMSEMRILNNKGEFLVAGDMDGYGYPYGYPAHRGELAMEFYKHAQEIGVDFRFGHYITSYWETDTEAGVVVDGEKISADCVIGADGVHSKARSAMTKSDLSPVSSGYAMYRAWFDAHDVCADPETKWLFDGTDKYDNCNVYIGPDVHVMLGTGKLGKEIFWQCTHKDIYDIEESWSFPGKVDDMLEVIKTWPARDTIEKIVRKTPKDQLIDFKLLWRDPLPTWVSPGGRMMVIGDAAHPFLPTSGQGAAQAMEDAATLAIALELGTKSGVVKSLRVTEAIRYKRVSKMQRLGVETRDVWHNTDWEAFGKDSSVITMPRPNWIFGHDCQEYAYMEYDKVASALESGEEYQPSNIPNINENHRTRDFRSQETPA